jgi:tellurite resistance protein
MADKSDNSGCLVLIGAGLIILALISFSNGGGGGGFVFLIPGVVLLIVAYNNSGIANQTPTQSNQASPRVGPPPPALPSQIQTALQLKVVTRADRIQDVPVNLLKFHTKGIFSNHQRIGRPCFEFRLSDVTDTSLSDGAPVLCVIDDLQDDDSTEFRFRQILPQALNAGAGSIDWVEFCSVPKELLVFPNTGSRRIKAILRVTDAANGRLITTANTVWSTSVEGFGYLEMEDEESEAQAASLKLAMCIAAADGRVDDDEVGVIKGWGERTVNALPNARQAARRSILNEALQTATREIRANRVSTLESDAIHALKEKEEARYLYDAYELCLNVLKADGEAHPEEMAQLTRLARQLGLNETKVRILTDRHLADVSFPAIENESQDDHILGITGDMSKDQIRKHLNKLYQKHQARTQHDNPEVIVKAKEWLDRIAKARVRHLS